MPVERHRRTAPLRAALSTGEKGVEVPRAQRFITKRLGPLEQCAVGSNLHGSERRESVVRPADERTMTYGTPVRRQCGPSRGPHSSVSLDRWRARPRGDLHPAWTASPVTKGARRCSRRGSIRRRVEFLFSVPSARANERSSQGGRHERGSHSRGTGVAQAPFAPHGQPCSTRTRCPASAPAFRFSSQDEWRLCRAPARQGWARIELFVESVPTFGVSVEVERRRRSRNVQRRGKPERCIDRIAEGAETPEANRRRAQDRGGQVASSGPPTACVDPQG